MVPSSHSDETSESSRLRQLEQENRELRRAVEELSLLNDLARDIGASTDPEGIMQTIVHRSIRAVDAQQGAINLVEEDSTARAETLVRTAVTSAGGEAFHVNQQLLGWMHHHKKPLRIEDPASDDRFSGAQWEEGIDSVLCVPLMVRFRLIGILTTFNKHDPSGFTAEDQRLLTIIAGQSAQVVENARLQEEEKRLVRMQEEVRLANQIQMNLMPAEAPELPRYEIAGKSRPAQTVGGDFFDYQGLSSGDLALSVADVQGKGLPASLLMASVQAMLRSQADAGISVKEAVERANRLLEDRVQTGTFVTLFYGFLKPSENRVSYVNAGHNPPLVRRADGTVEELSAGGLVLGVMGSVTYQVEQVELGIDDVLLLYSDGVTEAMNEDGEPFGEGRLREVVDGAEGRTAAELLQEILESVERFTGDTEQSDDVTVMVVRRTDA